MPEMNTAAMLQRGLDRMDNFPSLPSRECAAAVFAAMCDPSDEELVAYVAAHISDHWPNGDIDQARNVIQGLRNLFNA